MMKKRNDPKVTNMTQESASEPNEEQRGATVETATKRRREGDATAIRIMLCCNDERGEPTWMMDRVDFEDADGHRVALRGPSICCRAGIGWFGRRRFRVDSHQTWVGNVHWDAVRMSKTEALRLLRYLLERGYSADEWTCDGPFAAVLDAANP